MTTEAALTLTRTERDALRGRLAYDATDVESLCGALAGREDREVAVKLQDRVALWIDLLDEIGWQEEGSHELYPVTQSRVPGLLRWLDAALEEIGKLTAEDRERIARSKLGSEADREWAVEAEGLLIRDLREKAVLEGIRDSLLDELTAGAVA